MTQGQRKEKVIHPEGRYESYQGPELDQLQRESWRPLSMEGIGTVILDLR